MKYSGQYFKILRDDYFMPQALFLQYHFFDDLQSEIDSLIEEDTKSKKILSSIVEKSKSERRSCTDEEKTFLNSRLDIQMLPQLIFKNEESYYKDMHYFDSTVATVMERKTKLFTESIYHLEDSTEERISRQSIEPTYSRPKLMHFHKTIMRDISLNLALPADELKDFIEKLSANYQAEKASFKSIEGLFGKDKNDAKNNFTYRAKRISDMFYIYDYVTSVMDEAKAYNLRIEDRLLDPTLDKHDEASIREDLSPYTTATTIILSEDYGDELSKQLRNKRKNTIENEYNTIHRLIENNSYKNLI